MHDTTLMALLAAIGGATWLTHVVPYTSHLIFEVYQDDTSSDLNKQLYARVLYQGRPLRLPGCHDGTKHK